MGGAFASCISQYVMVVASSGFTKKVIAVVLPLNAVIMVSLQYAVGRRPTAVNTRSMMTTGTFFFIVGLSGFIFSGDNLFFLVLSAAVFTIAEIIYAPVEYMLIDNITPVGMKASYFSAQSLGWLGAAVNSLASSVILTTLPAWALVLNGMPIPPAGQAIVR